jgi:alpha-ribazole phosphatase/probable phosphoglycerate mutase
MAEVDFIYRSKPTRIYLARHGTVVGAEEHRINGHREVPLSEKGIEQFHVLGQRLAKEGIEAIYSSDLSRSLTGAEILGKYLDIRPEPPLAELREKNFGIFEGLAPQEMQERYPEHLKSLFEDWLSYRVPESESMLDMEERVKKILETILEKNRQKRVAIVGHGGVNRAILCYALNLPLASSFRFEQDYGCLNIIDFYERGAVVRLMNG